MQLLCGHMLNVLILTSILYSQNVRDWCVLSPTSIKNIFHKIDRNGDTYQNLMKYL